MSLPVTAEPLPSSFTSFGKVVGRVIQLVADTAADTDNKPEAKGGVGRITFTPKDVIRTTAEVDYPAIVLHATATATLSANGTLTDAENKPGIWLAVGSYTVTFEITGAPRAIPAVDILVTTGHTDVAPLDLATVVPYVPPTGTVVQTLVVPAGGLEGQVLTLEGGDLAWITPTGGGSGTGGAVDSVNGKTGVVVLSAADLGAQPAGSYATTVNGTIPDNQIPASIARDTEAQSYADAAKARATHTGTQPASTVTGLATVATSGAYADLSGKPVIPPAPPSDAAAGTASLRTLGTGATQAAAGNDARLSNARTPTAHSHPVTDLTATGTSDTTTFLRGDNTWATPPATTTPDATTTAKGIVELATNVETTTGTDTVRAVTPAGVKAVADTKVTAVTAGVQLWTGTQAAYDAIGTKNAATVYVVTA